MYAKIAQEEDNNKAEKTRQDVDGVLVYVSPHVTSPSLYPQFDNIDRIILRHCRGVACGHNPRPQA